MKKNYNPAGVPPELWEFPAWLTWHWQWDPNKQKWTKRPKTIVRDDETGKRSYNIAHCLRPLSVVLSFLDTRPKWGLGISFHANKPYPIVGIDLDDCRNPKTGKLTDRARQIVEEINSYTEISVSGKGLHILARAEIPRSPKKRGPKNEGRKIELFGPTGYLTFSGWRLEGSPTDLQSRQEAITALYEREFPPVIRPTRRISLPTPRVDPTPIEEKTVQLATGSSWDRSQFDYAACREYARATNGNPDEIYRLMERNPIAQKSKWAVRDDNYRYGLIQAAIESLQTQEGEEEYY